MTTELNLGWLDTSISQKTDVDKSDLRESLQTLGSEMTGVQADVADKASLSHNHTTDQIIDLDTQLSDRVTREDGISTRQRLEAPRFSLGGVFVLEGALVLNASDGLDFDIPLTENISAFLFQNLGQVSDSVLIATLLFRQGASAKTVGFPSNWIWPGGTVVAVGTANKATLYRIASYDGGETWYVLSANVYNGAAVSTLDGDLAYGGLFYGNGFGGAGALGNRAIRYSSDTGFVELVAATLPVYKTGDLTHIKLNNRINKSGDTGYGDGGCAAYLEVRKAKTDGTPDMSGGGLLGRTATYDPATVTSSDSDGGRDHPKLAFQSPAPVVAGQDICVVWRNDTEDSSKYYSANFMINDKPLNPRAGPAWGNRRVYRSLNGGSSWTEMKRGGTTTEPSRGMYVFFGELYYSGGIVHGDPYRFSNANEATTYWPLIDGTNNWCRQKFKMRAAGDFVAKAVWVRLLSEADNPTLVVRLCSSDGTLIEEVAVPASNITKMTSTTVGLISKILGTPRGNPNADTDDEIKWFRVPFTTSRTLVADTSYQLQLKAGSGSKCRIGGTLNAKRNDFGYQSLEGFDGTTSVTFAEYTTDNGGVWKKVNAQNGTSFSYDLPILFEA